MKIKIGATRKVFIFKNFVMKMPNTISFPYYLYGILGNYQEKIRQKEHFDLAKVLWCSPFYIFLIMEKANPIIDMDEASFVRKIKEKYKNDDLRDFMLLDLKIDNWGYIGDHLVKIDYAN